MNTSALIYDLEIVNAIPGRNEPRLSDITYCEGWHDHAHMGISVIGCYDYIEDRYRVFCTDNWKEFYALCNERDVLVGFNSIPFDNTVLDATLGGDEGDMDESKCYDLLRETWAAAGLGPDFRYPSHAGYGLDAICERNFGIRKTGHGAVAPVLWQQGKVGRVIDYCLNDIRMTKRLFDQVLARRSITDPKTGNELLLREPKREESDGQT